MLLSNDKASKTAQKTWRGSYSSIEGVSTHVTYKGTISKVEDQPGKYKIEGVYQVINATDVLITELPVGTWTDDYKSYLETIIESKKKLVIRDYEDNSTDKEVNILVKFAKGVLGSTGLDLNKLLKMTITKTTHNMHVFNSKEQLKKYHTVKELLDEFYEERLVLYEKRRQFRLKSIEVILKVITNKVKYIHGLLANKIDLRGKTSELISDMLMEYGLDKDKESYHYLTKMPMDSVSNENVEKLKSNENQLKQEYSELIALNANDLWCIDLDELEPFI